MFQEDLHIPYEIVVGKLRSLFTITAKKWNYKMRQEHSRPDLSWWKSEIITKWANNSWRFKMENASESDIFNSEKDKPLTWFLKQKDRLSDLHPDMSESMIDMKILRKCGGEARNAFCHPVTQSQSTGMTAKMPPKHGAGPNQLKKYQRKEETHVFPNIQVPSS
ncbi:hypothetical protein O181_028954 [Austropuccinia psidii MF-1]|uniref:Uncharacterized protein n=1 Tax=Austropuccinia psidii MF-1 TaxID=1389203 RepID=A0A9Q3CQ04_9BASI|nr:hypothetical protein [Austropuccinia psidii MF-1]